MNDHCLIYKEQNPAYGSLWFFLSHFQNFVASFSLALAFLLFLALTPACSLAGTIALDGQPDLKLTVESGQIHLRGTYAVKNGGDEIAPDVEPDLAVAGLTWKGDKRTLRPKQRDAWNVDISAPGSGLAEGAYALIGRISYADLNGYPFSNVSVVPITLGEPELGSNRLLALGIKAEIEPVSEKRYRADVEVFNLSKAPHHAKLTFLSPHDLSVKPQIVATNVAGGGFTTQKFDLENQTGLVGSNYILYIVAEWVEDGRAQFASTIAPLTLQRTKHGKEWLFAGILGSLLALSSLLFLGKSQS